MLIHDTRVDIMTPDQAKRPSVFDDMPDEDPDDGHFQAPEDDVASERKRKRRVIAMIVIMLLGVIAIIFTPLFILL